MLVHLQAEVIDGDGVAVVVAHPMHRLAVIAEVIGRDGQFRHLHRASKQEPAQRVGSEPVATHTAPFDGCFSEYYFRSFQRSARFGIDHAALDGVGSQVLRQEKARDGQGENVKSLLHKCLILRCG